MSRFVTGIFIVAILLATGCASHQKLMPLEIGSVWTYQCNSGMISRVEEFKITHSVPVGQTTGVALVSQLGTTSLAWHNRRLVAGELAGSEFFPPIPLLASISPSESVSWKGKVRTAGVISSADATLKTVRAEDKVGTQTLSVTQSILLLKENGKEHELLTWFAPDLGIVRQEHRINGSLVNRLRYVSGP